MTFAVEAPSRLGSLHFTHRPDAGVPRRSWLIVAAAVAVPVLHGCASGPSSGGGAPAPGSAPSGGTHSGAGGAGSSGAPRGPHPLAVERDWLRSWFEGTPVAIQQQGEGALTVEVPLAFSFEPRRSAVKPALAAVLDKLAQSLRRTGAQLPGLAAPADAGGPPVLALQRAAALRAHLLSRGVRVQQLGAPSTTQTAAVQLRAELPSPA